MGSLYGNTSPPSNHLYSYVYDCGTDQLKALRDELNLSTTHFDGSQTNKIDLVILSHLDSDHVNGFDALCTTFNQRIDTVVLPYLDIESRYYVAAKAMAEQTASSFFLEFAIDPVKWVRTRAPRAQIILLGPPPEDELNLPDDIPTFPSDGQSNDRLSTGNKDVRINVRTSRQVFNTTYRDLQQYRWVSFEPLNRGVSLAPILLLAHIPPRSDTQLNAFRSVLKKEGFTKISPTRLRQIIADADERDRLKECFMELGSDHNLVSIHLLVKSLCAHSQIIARYPKWRYSNFDNNKVGFLFAGDAKLQTNKYFNHWQTFYGPHLRDVYLFSLPHHGSKLSFNSRLLNTLPNAYFVAQAGNNGHGHPSKEVTDQIKSAGRRYFQVSENPDSRFDMGYELS